MNRELKFRVWDKQLKNWKASKFLVMRLETGELALNTGQGLYPIPDTGQKDLGRDRYAVQQFTGLKDKNGKEIYEGDILFIPNDNPADCSGDFLVIVKYKYGGFGYTDALNEKWDSLHSLVGETEVDDMAEVIGNIFENPELLKY